MADDKQYSESEHLAILSDRVAQETASLTAERDQLKVERDDLASKLDVAESSKLAAEQAKATAEQEFETFKTEVAEREAAASRKDTRVAEIKEKAAHLDDDWFAVEGRVDRIIAMKDDDFTAYVSDLASTAPVGGDGKREIPRETAMTGKQLGGGEDKTPPARNFFLRDYVQPQEA